MMVVTAKAKNWCVRFNEPPENDRDERTEWFSALRHIIGIAKVLAIDAMPFSQGPIALWPSIIPFSGSR